MAMVQHPSVYMCTPKEPHFLAMHGREAEIGGIGHEMFAKGNQFAHHQWLDLFAGRAEMCLMDASVSTISYPEVAIANIARYCADGTKIIAILRDPVNRAYSSYQYCLSKGWDGGSFENCLDQEPFRIAQNWQHLWFLKYLSQYELRLPPFLEAFGSDNVHIVIAEEFAADPSLILDGIFDFLDIPAFGIQAPQQFNASGVPKSRIVRGLSGFVRRHPALRKTLLAATSTSVREKLKSKKLAKPEMALKTREQLSRELAGTRPWVEQLIGRRLEVWS